MSRNYLEAFVIALVAAAFGFFLTWPKYVEVQETGTKIEAKRVEIKTRQDYYDNLAMISAQLDSRQEGMEKIKSAFPNYPDSPALMSFVQAAAMQSGMVLNSVDYAGLTKAAVKTGQTNSAGDSARYSLQKYKVSANLAGNYESLKNFLSRLEHSSRLIQLSKATVGLGKDDDAAGKKPAGKLADGGGEPDDPILEYDVSLLANYYQ